MYTRNYVCQASVKDAFHDKEGRYIFEINEPFIGKYQKGIKFYVDRLRGGATAGVRGKTAVQFWNPEAGVYEYITEVNENRLDYARTQIGDLEGGEINVAMASFLAQAYAEFLKDKLNQKPELSPKGKKTLVGFDTRHFSTEIGEMLSRILAGNGFLVFRNTNNAPSPTPVNSMLTYVLGCVGSLNVTASHNPADQNGIKPNNEKGHLDADDDLEAFLRFVEERYLDGKGTGRIEIAPLGENVVEVDFDQIYLERFIDLMMEDSFVNLELIRKAMKKGWGFIIDGIGGTGGPIMEKILSHLLGNSWQGSILIINKKPDPNMRGIAKPDPTKPEVMEQSGLLDAMAGIPNIAAGGTGDNDWDRFTAAIKIEEKDNLKAQRAGLFVSKQAETWLVRFTADQIYTLFGEYQLRTIARERYRDLKEHEIDMYSPTLDNAIKARDIDLSDCYLITTYPSSILTDRLTEYYGARLIYTSVGFKNIGIAVVMELEGKMSEDPTFKPIYVLGKEESGGNGFGFPRGAKIGPDGRFWLGTKDKDTSLNVLKLMEISADAYISGQTIVNLYSDMLDRLGILTFYERVDWYIRDKANKNQKSDAIKSKIAARADSLELPQNASEVAKLLGEKLAEGVQGEPIDLPNSYLWVKLASQDTTFSDGTMISKGEPIFNRVYDPEEKKPARVEGKWTFMPVKASKYHLGSGGYFTIFHAGEGPKITLHNKEGKPIYWTLIRPSGTEVGLIRNYNEVVCDKNHPDPWLLAKFPKPIMDYFEVPEYYNGDDYLKEFGEKSLTQILRSKYPCLIETSGRRQSK